MEAGQPGSIGTDPQAALPVLIQAQNRIACQILLERKPVKFAVAKECEPSAMSPDPKSTFMIDQQGGDEIASQAGVLFFSKTVNCKPSKRARPPSVPNQR